MTMPVATQCAAASKANIEKAKRGLGVQPQAVLDGSGGLGERETTLPSRGLPLPQEQFPRFQAEKEKPHINWSENYKKKQYILYGV